MSDYAWPRCLKCGCKPFAVYVIRCDTNNMIYDYDCSCRDEKQMTFGDIRNMVVGTFQRTMEDASGVPENCVVLPPMVIFDEPEPIRKK